MSNTTIIKTICKTPDRRLKVLPIVYEPTEAIHGIDAEIELAKMYNENKELRDAVEKFKQSQQPLGEEFEKVLYENLDELYITDEEENNGHSV